MATPQKNPLRLLAIFSETSDKVLDKLLKEVFRMVKVDPGTSLYEEGQEATDLYFVYTGKVVLTVDDELGLVVELTRLTQLGSTCGNESLVRAASTYDSSATTLEETVLIQLNSNKFDRFRSLAPKVADMLRTQCTDRETIKEISEKIPTFRNLSKAKQHQMSVIAQFVEFKSGAVIFTQDAMSSLPSFYILTRGEVEVVLDGKVVKAIKAGDYFGEVGLVSNKPHSATIRVPDDGSRVFCLQIANNDFKELFIDSPAVLAEFSLRIYGEDISFLEFIKHPKARASFLKHCEAEYAGENLDYLAAVESLENINKRRMRKSVLRSLSVNINGMREKKSKLLQKRAAKIIEEYVLDDAPHPVSMAGPVQQELIEKYKKNEFSFKMFEPSKELVYSILETDNYERYKKTPAFQEVLSTVGQYN